MATLRWTVGDVRISRVSYFDIGLPPEVIALEAEDLQRLADADVNTAPWTDEAGQPIVGQSFLVVESAGMTIVVDPCGASDAFLRTGPDAVTHQDAAFAAFADAGFDRHTVDTVLLSHLDGIGMVAWAGDDGWGPAFPNAEVIVSRLERQSISDTIDLSGRDAFEALDSLGVVRVIDLPHQLTEHITLNHTGVHTAGHLVATIASGGEQAAVIGHVAVSPLHLFDQVPARLHVEPAEAPALIADWLAFAATNGALLFGPLWPAPGAVRVVTDEVGRSVPVPAAP